MYVGFIGKLFLRMLKCVIIPLIIPSLIASIGKQQQQQQMAIFTPFKKTTVLQAMVLH